MKTFYKFIIVLVLYKSTFAQQSKIDSLQNLLSSATNDQNRFEILLQFSKNYRKFDLQNAEIYANRALDLATKTNNEIEKIDAIQELTSVYISTGKFDDGLKLTTEGSTLSKKNNDKKREVDCLSLAGYLYRRQGKVDLSLQSYQQCSGISKAISYKNGIGKAEKGFGDLNEKDGKYLKALDNYDLALKLAKESGDKELEMGVLNATGIIHDYQGNYEKALDYYIKAITIAEQMGNLIKSADFSTNIASLHFYMGNNDKALEYSLKGIEICKKTHNKVGEAGAILNIITVLNHLKRTDEAMKYVKRELELRNEMGDKRGLSFAYGHLARNFEDKKDYPNAKKYHEIALKYSEEIGHKLQIAAINLNLGRLMNNAKTPELAKPYLEKSLAITKEMGVLREHTFALEDLARSYAETNQMGKAYEYQKKFSKLNDSLMAKDRNEKMARMQTIFETKGRETKIANLEKEASLNQKVMKQDTLLRNLYLVGLVLLGLLAALFYNRFRLKKKTSEALSIKNIEIEKQKEVIQTSLGEKETLLREIHHRVKNNLQIISSLLNIQSENISDPLVLSSIREGQSRVQAMSLIHQNLYQSEHLSNVDIENYLKELVVYLSEMFAKEGKKIEVEVEANNINFDIDTAIPLGLIVNELVSNAYKYAFEQQASGKIKIGIKALSETEYELKVDDDGKGLPDDFNPSKSKSLGLKLVSILSRQLRGKFSSSSSKGANFVVLFKDLRAFQAN